MMRSSHLRSLPSTFHHHIGCKLQLQRLIILNSIPLSKCVTSILWRPVLSRAHRPFSPAFLPLSKSIIVDSSFIVIALEERTPQFAHTHPYTHMFLTTPRGELLFRLSRLAVRLIPSLLSPPSDDSMSLPNESLRVFSLPKRFNIWYGKMQEGRSRIHERRIVRDDWFYGTLD